MTWLGVLSQLLEIVVALLVAPLLTGWINQCRAWLQNRSGPGLLQPYRMLHKLFNKESVLAEHASPLFRGAPYIVFGCMALACAISSGSQGSWKATMYQLIRRCCRRDLGVGIALGEHVFPLGRKHGELLDFRQIAVEALLSAEARYCREITCLVAHV